MYGIDLRRFENLSPVTAVTFHPKDIKQCGDQVQIQMKLLVATKVT